jgi:aspartate aminotransferase
MMQLAAASPKAIRLDIGDPDFPTPAHVVEAAHQAARAGATHYLPSTGLPELRDVLADKVRQVNGVPVRPEQVIVTQGATQALFATLAVVAHPGDEVLIPDPAWPNYRMMAAALGLSIVDYRLTAETSYLPRVDELRALITERTRILVLNSPSNPLGTVLDGNLVEDFAALAARHDLWIVSDE